MKARGLLGSIVVGAVSLSAVGGVLTPPPAPITSTMKSLDAIEPRVCVNDLPGAANAVHVISDSGQYYLTGNIQASAGQNGILIGVDATDVSIDLNGFSIEGTPGSLNGIFATATPGGRNYAMHRFYRGYLTRTAGSGNSHISGFDQDGIHVKDANQVSILGVSVTANGGDGVEVAMSSAGGPIQGLEPMVVIEGVASSSNVGNGIVVEGDPSGPPGPLSKFDGVNVSSCMNGGDGIRVVDIGFVRVNGGTILGNGSDGIEATVLRPAGEGFFDISDSDVNDNVEHGVHVRSGFTLAGTPTLSKIFSVGSTMCGNGLDGIHAIDQAGLDIDECRIAMNGNAGVLHSVGDGVIANGSVRVRSVTAEENGRWAMLMELPVSTSFDIDIEDSNFVANGRLVPSPGVEIDWSIGTPNPVAKNVLRFKTLNATVDLNKGHGMRVLAGGEHAMAIIRNIRFVGNDGDGVVIEPAPSAPLGMTLTMQHDACRVRFQRW